jgi:diguanylate cyclase (GGDEF)-like protein/PAS domain S-box-containing protein
MRPCQLICKQLKALIGIGWWFAPDPGVNTSTIPLPEFSTQHECAFQQALDALTQGAYFVDRERRITYWNKACERITGFSAQEVLGRRCADNILCHVNDAGIELCNDDACPLRACMTRGQACAADVYLHHKLGYRVPVSVSGSPVRDRSGNITGAIELFHCNRRHRSLERRLSKLKTVAYVDPLTQVGNRRYLEEALTRVARKTPSSGTTFGVLLIDIDHFKRINDSYGHSCGDEVLLSTAQTLQRALRGSDLLGRWGGEEFLALLPSVDLAVLQRIADRCRGLARQAWVECGRERVAVTISVGGTLFRRRRESIARLIQRVDSLLYESKENGRDRTTVK